MGGIVDKIIQSKSKTFMAFCFSFLLGVFLASIFVNKKIDFVYFYFILFLFISFFIIFWRKNIFRFILFLLFIFIFGIFKYNFSFPSEIKLSKEKIELFGEVVSEPDVRQDKSNYIVETNHQGFNGRFLFSYSLYPRFEYGDNLKVLCSLSKPEVSEGFRYDMYLAKSGVEAICQNPKIEKLAEKKFSPMRLILILKNFFAEKINLLWHEPYASFMSGLLYGYRGGLGNLNDIFSRAGISHIVAISGYNITIIANLLMLICINLFIPRKKAFGFIILGIILFVLFTGASASVVRAGVMGILVLCAKQIGRLSRVGNILVLTAVIMVLQNPFVLVWDAGFQLSFLATLGLVYFTPAIRNYFGKVPEVFGIREVFISTLCAIVATLPLILFNFGRLSLVAPVVNILTLWIIPFLMLVGFLAVISSFVFFPLAQVVAWFALVGMKYVVLVADWSTKPRFSNIDFSISWWLMAIVYVLMIKYIYYRLKKFKVNNYGQ